MERWGWWRDRKKAERNDNTSGKNIRVNDADVKRITGAMASGRQEDLGVILSQLLQADLSSGAKDNMEVQRRLVREFLGWLRGLVDWDRGFTGDS